VRRVFDEWARNNAARILVALGAIVLIAAALLHLSDYPKDLSVVSASNLGAPLKGAVRGNLLFGPDRMSEYPT
jgi:hypothetical protein